MQTARELADRVRRTRQATWDVSDPTTAIVSTNTLNPDDERVVRRVVTDSGLRGPELEAMVQHVSAILVGQVIALDDNQPVEGGD